MKNIPVLTVLLLFFVSFLNAQNKFINFLECEKYNQERAILLFYKPDCPYCLHLRNDIESNLQFQEVLQSKYSITLVDVTALEGQNLALKYGVKSVPLIICYDSNNSEVKRIKGYNSLSKIASYLDLKSSIVSTSKNGLNICGDGILDSDEECDDGNVINGDGCESNCTISILSYDNFNESSKKFSLFPMPFLNNFSIEFQSNNETDFTTSIYNERGQLIKHQSQINTINGNLIIHVSELDQLKSGIYFLKIENSNQSFNVIRKIVKI